ncbi:hypothetical protein DNTS_035807 [Danionella cerebrum]|uniref:Fibronectin type-III domain-containing protein n=1 Tax=Danionella cerebrum TaxID=2873325 RepID=A0A553Q3D3_9TELE|nr:hypothetical protein DNTS_035807 [Danionella translucida]
MDIIFNIPVVFILYLLPKTSGSSLADVLPEPKNVHLSSFNLRNLVKWTPGDISDNRTIRYTVQYAIYGELEPGTFDRPWWRDVKGCVSIPHTECDASEETYDEIDEYYARVRATHIQTQRESVWSSSSTRFIPLSDMVLGAPSVEVTVVQNFIIINMKGPFRWKTKSSQKDKSFWEIFHQMNYIVFVSQSENNYTVGIKKLHWHSNGSLTVGPLSFSSQFCVVVQAQANILKGLPSDRQCVNTAPDEFRDQLMVAMLGGVLPSALCVCVLLVLGGLIHRYINDHRQKLPTCNHMVQNIEKLPTFQHEVPHTVIINLIKTDCFEDDLASLVPAKQQPSSDAEQKRRTPQHVSIQDIVIAEPVNVQTYTQQQQDAPVISYAQQQELPMNFDSSDEEHTESTEFNSGDYGIVVQEDSEETLGGYMTQDEKSSQIFLDWSPGSKGLKIPLMGLDREPQNPEQFRLLPNLLQDSEGSALLPNLILRQESVEMEDEFSRMEKDWGLVIYSNSN